VERLIYLDTHVVVWLYAGEIENIPFNTLEFMKTQELFFSPMVMLEIAYLHEINRITVTSHQMINTLMESIGLKACHLPYPQVIEQAIQQTWTRDPFDRIIVGQAAARQSLLITKDAQILNHYAYAIWN
jgi:PIN domain nuclease of toxin-antitoxin system